MSDQPPTCCICGREMRSTTRPHWVFEQDYSVRGQAHSSCTLRKPWGGRTARVGSDPLPMLQFRQWVWDQPHPYDSPEWNACMLAVHEAPSMATGRLGPLQEELLRWWQEGPRQLSAETIQATRAAYDGLLVRFRAAGLPPVPDGADG